MPHKSCSPQFEGLDVTSSDSSRFGISANLAEFPVDDRRACAGVFPVDSAKRSCYTNSVTLRSLFLQVIILAFIVTGFAEPSHALDFGGFAVYVGDRSDPGDFDPYFNQPKIYRQPRYYESTSKKRKGNKVFKTTKVKDQYGHTVYKKTTSQKAKKKK